MSSQSKINAYMERHRLGPLFEDLMNKVLRDMPEEPLVYMLRSMYKKAGMEIPQGIRYGGLRKSTADLSRSPERPVRSAQVSRSTDVTGVAASREYDRPWATSPTRKMKTRKSEDLSGQSKHRQEWNSDVKTKASPFDDFWQQGDGGVKDKDKGLVSKKSHPKMQSSPASAWASVGVLDADEVYTSPVNSRSMRGGPTRISEEELLASETIKPSKRSDIAEEMSTGLVSRSSRGPRLDAQKQRQKMAQTLKDVEQNSDDSGVGRDLGHPDDPDAIELLEDADDLRREGVTNIPKSGYKLSKAMRYRKNEPRVKLSLNLNPERGVVSPWQERSSMYDYHNSSLQSSPDQVLSDEEFESVSQVSGPRQPVWKLPTDVDRDFPPREPSYSRETPLSSSKQRKSFTEQSLSGTTPNPIHSRSVLNATDLDTRTKSWTAGEMRVSFEDQTPSRPDSSRSQRTTTTDSGGWMVPEDTEVASALDWNQRVKGGRRQDPRSY